LALGRGEGVHPTAGLTKKEKKEVAGFDYPEGGERKRRKGERLP